MAQESPVVGVFTQRDMSFGTGYISSRFLGFATMTGTLLKRLATLAALITLAATLSTTTVSAQETRPGSEASLAADQTPSLQIDRLYLAIFGRQPDPGGKAFWLDQLTSGARTLSQIADLMVGSSDEFTDLYGALDNNGFVNQLYLNVQGRNGDAGGIAFWSGELASRALTRGGVVLGFSESVEFREAQGSADPLDRLYCAFFLRNPDPGGKRFWTDQYLVAEQSLGSIAQQFTGVPEFSDLYGPLTDRQFVELIYKNVLGRGLPLVETTGPNFWTGQLNTGARTRGSVMVEFSESPEYQQRWTRNAPCPAAGNAVATAVDDNATVTFAGSVTVNWAQNDTLPAGTTVAITTQGANGTAVDNGNGTFTYTRNTNSATTDSFTYTVTSADSITDTGTVNVTILLAGADGIPTAVDDVFSVPAGAATDVAWATNDTTDESVSVKSFTQPANGTVTYSGGNTFVYTPNGGFTNGTDTFTYTLTDGGAPEDTSTATVTVNVGSTDIGAAVADRFIVIVNTATDLDVLANDNTAGLSLSDPGTATHGTLEIVGNAVRYTPDTGYTASRTGQGLVGDSFTYTLTDASGNTSQAAVEVVVLAQPECEVFMNYPYTPEVGAADPGNIELFFSSLGCFELYDSTQNLQVSWNNVTVDGAVVTTTSPNAANVLRDLAPVSAAAAADFDVTIAGTAVMTVNGATAITIQFGVQFTSADNGATWNRSGFRGRGPGDVTVTINPLAS